MRELFLLFCDLSFMTLPFVLLVSFVLFINLYCLYMITQKEKILGFPLNVLLMDYTELIQIQSVIMSKL